MNKNAIQLSVNFIVMLIIAIVIFGGGNAFLAKGHTDLAIKHYRIALHLNPDSLEPHNNLAIIFYRNGDIKKALEHFKAALEINPNSIGVRNNLEYMLKLLQKNQ